MRRLLTLVAVGGAMLLIGLPLGRRFASTPGNATDSPTDLTQTAGSEPLEIHTLRPKADGTVFATKPDQVAASSPELMVDADPFVSSLILFAVPNVEGQIASARLRLTPLTAIGAPIIVTKTETTWTEDTLTYPRRPNRVTSQTARAAYTTDDLVEVDVTQFIEQGTTVSLAVEHSAATLIRFSSREGPSPPELVLVMETEGNDPPRVSQPPVHLTAAVRRWAPVVGDGDGDELTCWLQSAPQFGTAQVAQDCSEIIYRPDPGGVGGDQFDYAVHDGVHTVTVSTEVVFDAPVGVPVAAEATSYVAPRGSSQLTLRALDPDGRCPISFEVVSPPAVGTLGPLSDKRCSNGQAVATVSFTPAASLTDLLTLEYTANDEAGLVSAPAVITLIPADMSQTIVLEPIADGVAVLGEGGSPPFARLIVDSEPPRLAFLKFDLSEHQRRPTSGHISLYIDSPSFEGIDIHIAADEWDEAALRAGIVPEFESRPFTSTGAVWDGEWVTVPLGLDLLHGDTIALALTTAGSRAISVAASESFQSPQLTVTFQDDTTR